MTQEDSYYDVTKTPDYEDYVRYCHSNRPSHDSSDREAKKPFHLPYAAKAVFYGFWTAMLGLAMFIPMYVNQALYYQSDSPVEYQENSYGFSDFLFVTLGGLLAAAEYQSYSASTYLHGLMGCSGLSWGIWRYLTLAVVHAEKLSTTSDYSHKVTVANLTYAVVGCTAVFFMSLGSLISFCKHQSNKRRLDQKPFAGFLLVFLGVLGALCNCAPAVTEYTRNIFYNELNCSQLTILHVPIIEEFQQGFAMTTFSTAVVGSGLMCYILSGLPDGYEIAHAVVSIVAVGIFGIMMKIDHLVLFASYYHKNTFGGGITTNTTQIQQFPDDAQCLKYIHVETGFSAIVLASSLLILMFLVRVVMSHS